MGEQPSAYSSVRRNEVVLFRLKLGHSYLTHSCLLIGEPPTEYVTCQGRLTINHILVQCIEYGILDVRCLTTMLRLKIYLIKYLKTKSSHLSKELNYTILCNSFIVPLLF